MCVKTLRTFHSENSLMLRWYAPISALRIWILLKIHLNSLLRMRRLQQHSNKSSKVVRNGRFLFSSSRFVKELNRIDIFRHPLAVLPRISCSLLSQKLNAKRILCSIECKFTFYSLFVLTLSNNIFIFTLLWNFNLYIFVKKKSFFQNFIIILMEWE